MGVQQLENLSEYNHFASAEFPHASPRIRLHICTVLICADHFAGYYRNHSPTLPLPNGGRNHLRSYTFPSFLVGNLPASEIIRYHSWLKHYQYMLHINFKPMYPKIDVSRPMFMVIKYTLKIINGITESLCIGYLTDVQLINANLLHTEDVRSKYHICSCLQF